MAIGSMNEDYKAILKFNIHSNSVLKYMPINREAGVEHVHTHTVKFCSSREKNEVIHLWENRTGNYLIKQDSAQKDNYYIHASFAESLDFNLYRCMCKCRYGS